MSRVRVYRWPWLWLLFGPAGACTEPPELNANQAIEVPDPPRPLEPKNASYTGNAVAPGALRPLFTWSPTRFAIPITYDLELDDDCAPGDLQACPFSSPAARATGLRLTEWQPARDLPIADRAPVGRRYYWRLRACSAHACSPWSRVRYVDVGRVAGDLNGDGFSDTAIGAPLIDNAGNDRGSTFVYYGGVRGVSALAMTRLDGPLAEDGLAFGVSTGIAGDVDADGFADLLVGAPGAADQRGAAFLYFGGPDGVAPNALVELNSIAAQPGDWYGATVAGAGDVDGDGFADVIVGASGVDGEGPDWGEAIYYSGGPGGPDSTASAERRLVSLSPRDYDRFGFAVASAGDVNGDGYSDIVIGSPGAAMAGAFMGVDRGVAYVFEGGRDGPSLIPGARLESPDPADHDRFGFAVCGAGDVDGDGYCDVVVGAPGANPGADDGGAVFVFHGGTAGVNPDSQVTLEDPRIERFDRFGTSCAAAGDVNGDGFGDFIVGTSGPARGRGLVFHGGREGVLPMPAAVLRDPLGEGYNHFAEAVAGAGDVDGDGFDDVLIGASGSDNGGHYRGSAVLYPGGPAGLEPALLVRVDNPDTGEHDHFGHGVAGR